MVQKNHQGYYWPYSSVLASTLRRYRVSYHIRRSTLVHLNFVHSDRVRAIAAAMNLITIVWTSGTAGNGLNYDTGGMLS